MRHDDGRLVGVGIKGICQPGSLFCPQGSLGDHGFVQRIEQEEVCVRCLYDGNMFRFDRRCFRLLFLHDAVKYIAFVMIAQSQVRIDFCFLQGANQFCEMAVIAGLTIPQRQG